MCGLVGIITTRAHKLGLAPGVLEAMRDRLAHRGPDGAGAWRNEHAAIGHRRLAVLDPTPAGHQPYEVNPGGAVLAYNGELYNDHDLRAQIGQVFRSQCDTETLWHALSRWGREAPTRLRGMYALAWYDPDRHTLMLARDPLGIKPLYVWEGRLDGVPVVAFASEVPALFEHAGITPEPDMLGASAYLTTIRTVNGERTMFAGVRALVPGQVIEYDLSGASPRVNYESRQDVSEWPVTGDFGSVFVDSVHRHLRSDVPWCAMLSGGLDSSAICTEARGELSRLHTYCAASAGQRSVDGVPQSDDLAASELVSRHLGTDHTSVELHEALFVRTWLDMVDRLGVPLSTPNETAIHLLCRRMKAAGRSVTLSGEGADELLGGYESPMAASAAHVASGNADPGGFQLGMAAWCPPELKDQFLLPDAWQTVGRDGWLLEYYRQVSSRCADHATEPLAAHLRFHREVNLTGLLGRLDTASMLASVEGRTPFADVAVASLGESLPMSERYDPRCAHRTKIALRRAYADRLPASVVSRPKASFPLPFQVWMGSLADSVAQSEWIRSIVSPEALLLVTTEPATHWRLAWPIYNLTLWGERWWGHGLTDHGGLARTDVVTS